MVTMPLTGTSVTTSPEEALVDGTLLGSSLLQELSAATIAIRRIRTSKA